MKMPKEKKRSSLINLIGVLVLFAVLVLACESGLAGSYVQGILMTAGISIIMATSLNIATGFLGQLALGHAGFMCIGAYTAALITKAMAQANILVGAGLPNFFRFMIAILAGGCLAALFGVLVGIPALRLRGDYLAIITLGFGEIIRVVIQNLPFCGAQGLSQGKAGQALVGINRIANLYWVFWIVVITVTLLFCFVRSRYGRAIMAIREDDIASGAAGIHNTYYKVLAFALSAFFAGIAGGIYAHYLGTLDAGSFTFVKSTDYVIMVVFGGMGSLTGSVFAAAVLSVLPELLRVFSDYRMLAYSVALVLIMIFKPTGLFGNYEFSLTRAIDSIPGLPGRLRERIRNRKQTAAAAKEKEGA